MNFYLLDSKNPIPWVSTYKSLYYRELQNAGNQCQYIMPTELADLRESDFVIFGHYREFLESKKYHKRYKSIMQSNGTACNPFIYQVDPRIEYEDLCSVDFNLTAHDNHTRCLMQKYDIGNIFTVGFPMEIPDISLKKNKNTFVIAGRLSPDKNVYLAVYSIMQYCQYESITICYQNYTSKELSNYPIASWKELNVSFVECNRSEYLSILGRSDFYVNFSLGDVASITTMEALLCNCYPLLLDFDVDVPHYSRYINHPIPISRLNEIGNIVRIRPNQEPNMDSFNPTSCVQKLLKICEF